MPSVSEAARARGYEAVAAAASSFEDRAQEAQEGREAEVRTLLGRGGGNIEFRGTSVIKTSSRSQLVIIQHHPEVFVKILGYSELESGVKYTMPRLRAPDVMTEEREALGAGLRVLRDKLWAHRELFPQPEWRPLLWAHLKSIWPTSAVKRLVDRLPDVVSPCAIHGDATLANLLWDRRRGWVWCDPIDRAYIPHDPLVDLGKMFQSCWGYERLLLGEIAEPEFNGDLAQDLADFAGLNFSSAQDWCFVHILRLLSYQDPPVCHKFTDVLKDWGY